MKAIRVHQFGPPGVLQFEDVPDPSAARGQVLVRIRAAGVNPADTYIRSGTYAFKPKLPYTPGADGAGVIEQVGNGVTGLTVGQRVYVGGSITGTYAQLALCTPEQVHQLPENISFEQGAALYVPYATAFNALLIRAAARAGETVLIHGATGGVGLAAIQLARAAKLTVIATGGSPQGLDLLRRQGAHHVLDHKSPDYLQQIRPLTSGKGVDVILEMLANINLGKDLPLLAKYGRVAVVGSRGSVEISPRDLMQCQGTIIGIQGVAEATDVAKAHAAIGAGLRDGTITPVVDRTFPLSNASDAHDAVIKGPALGKLILLPD